MLSGKLESNVTKTTFCVPKANVLGVGVGAINTAQATQLILDLRLSVRIAKAWCST
jgi:hypothetical protein